jgi:NADPH:quinone reductase-like Zn-dependent oxidoreductase
MPLPTMNAVVYETYGTPDQVLKLKNVQKPVPNDNEVLIKAVCASVNSWDCDLTRGFTLIVRLGGFFKPRFPTLGADVSGRVEAVGKNIKRFKVGDEVVGDLSGYQWGTFAEYVLASESFLSIKPPEISFEQAAALPQAGVLALQSLRLFDVDFKGKNVLILGAGGGVGTYALQLLKLRQAHVTVVDRTGKLEALKVLGAQEVIDYTKEDFTKNKKRYDLILGVMANQSFLSYLGSLKTNGTFVMIGGETSLVFKILFLGPVLKWFTKKKMKILIHRPNPTDQNELLELLKIKTLTSVIQREYHLSEVAEAVGHLADGNALGKIVIKVSPT